MRSNHQPTKRNGPPTGQGVRLCLGTYALAGAALKQTRLEDDAPPGDRAGRCELEKYRGTLFHRGIQNTSVPAATGATILLLLVSPTSANAQPGVDVPTRWAAPLLRTQQAAAPRPIDAPPPVPPETVTRDAAGHATVQAVRLTEPLRLDGALDENMYETVLPVGGFIQQLPKEGEPATERTDAWVFYDQQNVYVSARLWDSAPESQWVANEMQRDSFQLVNNEFFSVAFDTFYDRRNGAAFMVNPIGGFMDYEIADEGFSNSDWNPIWSVRTGRFDGGWTVEMAIPFKSIRFRPGASQIWGLQLARNIASKNERVYLTPIPASAGPGEFRRPAR